MYYYFFNSYKLYIEPTDLVPHRTLRATVLRGCLSGSFRSLRLGRRKVVVQRLAMSGAA